VFYVDQTAEN